MSRNRTFSHFQYGVRFSRSNTDRLIVASDRIGRVFNRFGVIRAAAVDIQRF